MFVCCVNLQAAIMLNMFGHKIFEKKFKSSMYITNFLIVIVWFYMNTNLNLKKNSNGVEENNYSRQENMFCLLWHSCLRHLLDSRKT